jgi:predicted P-loop ATPase
MRVAYIFNRLGVALDDVVAWGRERYAAEFPEYAETMKRCYTAAAAEFAADKSTLDNLRGNRLKNDSLPIATVVDVENFLSTQIVARYNQTSGRLEYKSVGEGDDKFVNLEDIMVNTLWCRMSRFFRVNDRYITHVLASEYSRPYNPIMEYLNSLPEWDESQPDYLDILAKTVTVEGGAAKQAQFSKHLRKWLVGMVAGWINPKVVNHVILVLLGRQGAFKSAWFANLLPPELRDYYVIKTNSSYLDKDDHLCFSNKLMVLFDEVDTMDARNTNQLKAAVTATHSDIRAPYAHFSEHRKHIASLCGTGNKRCFLNDDTGTRRWLVYWVKSIVSPFFNENNYTGIYSQAYALYKKGFQYWFDADEIAEQEEHNKQFSVAHMERELIQTYFRKPYPNEIGEIYSASAILSYISGSIGYKLTVERVNSAMEQLGFERRRTATTRGWLCIKRTPDEIAEFRKRLAMDSEPDDQ